MTDSETMPLSSNDRTVVVRLPSELHEAVRARAKAEDRSMAAIVRLALRRYVEPRPMPVPADLTAPVAQGGVCDPVPPNYDATLAAEDPLYVHVEDAPPDVVVEIEPDTTAWENARRLSEDIAAERPMSLDEASKAVNRAMEVDPEAIVGALKVAGELAAKALKGTPEKCLHPVTRRLGKQCGACGETVK